MVSIKVTISPEAEEFEWIRGSDNHLLTVYQRPVQMAI
jgi:hypothetical protein